MLRSPALHLITLSYRIYLYDIVAYDVCEKFMRSTKDVLFQIGQHFRDGYLHKDEFKIVYVAPMKVKPSRTVLWILFIYMGFWVDNNSLFYALVS